MKTQRIFFIYLPVVLTVILSGWLTRQVLAGDNPLKEGLVLYLSFDKVDETGWKPRIPDQSGQDNHGYVASGTFVPGIAGNAFKCSAINKGDGIIIKDSDSLDLDAVTIAAWIKTDQADGQWNRILDKGWASAYNLCIGGDYKGKTMRHQVSMETAKHGALSKQNVVDGKWHFIVGTYDGQVSRIYIDGKLDMEKKCKEPCPMQHNDADIRIGQLAVPEPSPHDHAFFDGLIDEVRLYNRVLSDKEIFKLYHSQTKKKPETKKKSA